MNYIRIDTCDIANGNGVGVVLWVAGCDIHCKGCHNQSTWDFGEGKMFNKYSMRNIAEALGKPYIKRFTISGGHPLAPQNTRIVAKIIKTVKHFFPNIEIWLYTGYKFEDCLNGNEELSYCVKTSDIVVDGQYVESLRDISLRFRGSSNQRIIDVKKSLEAGKTVLWDESQS